VQTLRRHDAAGRLLPYVAIVVAGIVAFLPGLRAGFVSDDFVYIGWAAQTSFTGALHRFVPIPHFWYRPLNDTIFWVEHWIFGAQPVAYHAVALICHLGISILLFRLIRTLGVGMPAALAATGAFALSIHADELVFWWAAGHYAFGGLALVAAVLAYAEGWTWLTVAFAVLAILSDEAGATVIAVLVAYEVLVVRGPSLVRRATRLAPVAAVTAGYLVLRLATGGFWSESQPCHAVRCDTTGALEYFDRLLLRPDRLIDFLRPYDAQHQHRLAVTAALVGALLLVAAALRVWRWRDGRVIAFGLAWCGISTALLVYALYPYVSDRFLYYPTMGLAVAIGGAAQQAVDAWTESPPRWRLAAAGVLAVYAAWLAAGVVTLWQRGGEWMAAGQTVASIFDSTHQLEPVLLPGTVLVYSHVPDSRTPDIPPGNTGPYLLRNGIAPGVQTRYDGRRDVIVIEAGTPVPPRPTQVVCLDIRGADVVPVDCPT
jgi:hypothetical protein